MKQGTLKQILLMTDGCSNKGGDPCVAAAMAKEQGITVNVIGILDDEQAEESSDLQEVQEIALSGGGMSQIVYKQSLSQTVQMVTKQGMTKTLQGVVNAELQQILGSEETMEDLDPKKRGEMMEVVEDMGETSDLEVLVMVDTSASMHDKLSAVKDSLLDLSLSLNARLGKNKFSIFSFPGKRNKMIEQVLDWSPQLEAVSTLFPKLTSGGMTPTSPAIKEAIYQFGKKNLLRRFRRNDVRDSEDA